MNILLQFRISYNLYYRKSAMATSEDGAYASKIWLAQTMC